MNTLRKTLLRDKKEAELKGIESSIKSTEGMKLKFAKEYDRVLQNYHNWLKDNDVKGVKY
jgi:hypothetical protein